MKNKNHYHYLACILTVVFIFIAYNLVDNYKYYLRMKQYYEIKNEHPLLIREFEINSERLLKDNVRSAYYSNHKYTDYFSSSYINDIMEQVRNTNQQTLDTDTPSDTLTLINAISSYNFREETVVEMSNIMEYLIYNSENILEETEYQNILTFYRAYLSFYVLEGGNKLNKEKSLDALQFYYFSTRFYEMMLETTGKTINNVNEYGYNFGFKRFETSITEFQVYIRKINQFLSEEENKKILQILLEKYQKVGLE